MLVASAVAQCTGSPNCTVKAGGGGGYTTIQACATAQANGDTCTVFAGTYAETPTLSAGGVGSYKTLTVNLGDTVNVLGFTNASHTKINGFTITNPSSPKSAPCVAIPAATTDYFITNNMITQCGQNAMISTSISTATSHGFIQGNTLSWGCTTPIPPATLSTWGGICRAMTINGDYHLIENNDISHTTSPFIFGKHNVFRKNTWHDTSETNDCTPGGNDGNCHADLVQVDANVAGGGQPAAYLLVEANTMTNMSGSDLKGGGLFQAETCNGQCTTAQFRFNLISHIDGGGVTDDNSQTTPSSPNSPPWINVKVYNNDWVDIGRTNNGSGTTWNNFSYGSSGGGFLNNLTYFVGSLSGVNIYSCQDANNGTANPACAGPIAFAYGNNLAYCTGGTCSLYGHTYGSGAFTSDPGNIQTDPLFVNYSGNNFYLTATSPALAGGNYLTTVASGDSGSGTSLVVNDATYFQDGSGITGVQGDCISVTTVGNHVCITAINYSTNTLTLASGFSRSSGDHVWLYSDSSGTVQLPAAGPNIGADQSVTTIIPSGSLQNSATSANGARIQ